MLSPAEVSAQVELKRKTDPYYLTSRVLSTGSLLTEGEHVYIDKTSHLWPDAFRLMLEKVLSLQQQYQASRIVIRDFHDPLPQVDQLMADQGFLRITLPETSVVENLNWQDPDGFYQQLSKRSRQHFREEFRRYENWFEISIVEAGHATASQIDRWYSFYTQVKNHNLELNTFSLPRQLFADLMKNKGWEVIELRLKPAEHDPLPANPVCMVYCYRSGDSYCPMIIGLDYTCNQKYGVYRQALYRIVMRAKEIGMKRIYLGFSAAIEKKKMGARQLPVFGYILSNDTYNTEVLTAMNWANNNIVNGAPRIIPKTDL